VDSRTATDLRAVRLAARIVVPPVDPPADAAPGSVSTADESGPMRRTMTPSQWEVAMDIRWIGPDGIRSIPLSQIRKHIAPDDGIIWAHR
jgi:hypothetical protein